LTFHSNARAVSARASRILDRRPVALLLKWLSSFAFGVEHYIIFERSSSSSVLKAVLFFGALKFVLLSTVVAVVERALDFISGVEVRIIFQRWSFVFGVEGCFSFERLRSSSVLKPIYFSSARILLGR
jgi:hypothetical protein